MEKGNHVLARRMDWVKGSAIMEMLKAAGGDCIFFASGLPDPALYPLELLREITDDVLTRDGWAQRGRAEDPEGNTHPGPDDPGVVLLSRPDFWRA